ncbi:hypothetical protein [Streptomyces sp. NPDC048001]|uniref:hypothetical protein n=1 Tax=Streptomyces sp. NPDC048001 TaxID=3365498 RepID=UPI00371CF51D
MGGSAGWARRGAWLIAPLALASMAVGCKGGDVPGAAPPGAEVSSGPSGGAPGGEGPGEEGGKESAAPAPGSPDDPGGSAASDALTCEQLRDADLQTSAFRIPDAPAGAIAFTDGRWEGGGVVVELQPQCAVGQMTGDPAHDAVAAVKVTTGGTGRFYALVTWRNDGGTPVPAAAVSLGDRTPVQSVAVSTAPPARATAVHLTRGEADPAAVVTIRRTAVYRVAGPLMVELHRSDTPYHP